MGVIRNFNQNLNSDPESDWVYLSSDGEESAPNHIDLDKTRKHIQRSNKKSIKPEPTFMGLGAKGKSHKKFRRYANANLAMTDLGSLVNEADLEEISVHDFIPQSNFSFAMLLRNLDQMMDYDKFIDCTEAEQNTMLGQDIELVHYSLVEQFEQNESEQSDSRRCFFRIDPTMRKQLLKRHIPLGVLVSIEAKIVPFFKDNPQAKYQAHLRCSFQRFLLHACCQYLNLHCQSVNIDGKRVSFVRNKNLNFSPPAQLLSEYLELNL